MRAVDADAGVVKVCQADGATAWMRLEDFAFASPRPPSHTGTPRAEVTKLGGSHGRGLVLRGGDAARGDLVFEDTAAGAVVATAHWGRVCHCCYRRVAPKPTRCDDCGAAYCNAACRDAHAAAAHDNMCARVGMLREVAAQLPFAVDVDAAHLTLALSLSRRPRGGGQGMDALKPMLAHRAAVGAEAWRAALALGSVLRGIAADDAAPRPAAVTEDEALAEAYLKVRFNAQPFGAAGDISDDAGAPGLAIFSRGYAVNHACAPKVVASTSIEQTPAGPRPRLELRAAVPVLCSGDEVLGLPTPTPTPTLTVTLTLILTTLR